MNNKKIKIIHIQLFPLMSGVQKVSFDEISLLDENLFERIVVCKCDGEFTEQLRKLGVRIHLIPELKREISLVSDFLAYFQLRAFLKRESPDIVHTHSSKTGILGRFAAHAANVKAIIHTVHGYSFPGEQRLLFRFIFMLLERMAAIVSHKIIVLNSADAEISNKVLRIPRDKLALVPNGVDVTAYSPPTSKLRILLREKIFEISSNQHLIVGMVGRLSEQKNPHCFLQAALSVAERHSNVSFVMIGDGELRPVLQPIIQNSRHRERISILGWRRDITDILQSIDIMVLPSRWEGMPLAILESMSIGVPVIASNISGNNHLIRDGIDGTLFPSGDAYCLAQSLDELIDNPAKRASYALKARKKILSSYSLASRIQNVLVIYYQLLKRPYINE